MSFFSSISLSPVLSDKRKKERARIWGWKIVFENRQQITGNKHTDPLNRNLDPRAQDLVPAVDAPDEPAAPLEAARAAERVRERGRGGEVRLERLALRRRRGLRQQVDDLRDLGFCGSMETEGGLAGGVFCCCCFLGMEGGGGRGGKEFYAGLP